MSRRPKAYDGQSQCPRCATQLPVNAIVCMMCGGSSAVPMQLPAPSLPHQRDEAA